ncbi:MAG TPA: (2Fe-2S)-binding protein [Gemmatimonadaceae bacterium]|nr:(2Fe-2S)-binding protein [Gemmatimonadaceae bacterium]
MGVFLKVNGRTHEVDAPADERLLTTIRDRLELTGTKLACGRGECGACTILLDGRLAYSCLTLTGACDSMEITTIEGVGTPEAMHPVQQAFVDHDAAQCGFCTPGQVLAAIALLERDPHPSDESLIRGMSGNLCRCGTYPNIRLAIKSLGGGER